MARKKPTGRPVKRGRATSYTATLADEICARLAAGESLLEICRDEHMPAESTVRGWAIDDAGPGFAAKYTRARDIGLDHEADEIKRLADEVREGVKREERETGERECSECDRMVVWRSKWVHSEDKTPLCEDGKAVRVTELKTVTGDMIERAKLQVDARKWRLSKMAPKKYGDRLELAGDPEAPLNPPLDLSRLSDDELLQVRALMAKAKGESA
jgi:hypothetical protein